MSHVFEEYSAQTSLMTRADYPGASVVADSIAPLQDPSLSVPLAGGVGSVGASLPPPPAMPFLALASPSPRPAPHAGPRVVAPKYGRLITPMLPSL